MMKKNQRADGTTLVIDMIRNAVLLASPLYDPQEEKEFAEYLKSRTDVG
jgi:hypothetical protein